MKEITSIVIVGAGQAAGMAAVALRDNGFTGRITLLGREAHAPYERPPLSKAVLCGAEEPVIGIHAQEVYPQRSIELRTGVQAQALEPEAHRVVLSDGSRLAYDRCLLATGGSARELPDLPRDTPGVYYLRTLDDARRLRAALIPQARVIVVGGGFLGLELASSARQRQARVTVLEAAPRLLERALPESVSDWLASRIRRAGVRLELGASLRSSRTGSSDHAVRILELDSGEVLQADVVVVSVGLAPEIVIARNAGLELDPANGGIRIDAVCRTSVIDVYAAGDCASQHRHITGAHARFESWQNANEQGRAAAAAMLGLPPTPVPYPWFWTDQFDCNLQILGLPLPGLEYVLRGNAEADPAKALWLGHRNGVPVHGISVNAGGDLRVMRPLFEQGLSIDPADFCNESMALRAQVKAARQPAP